MNWTPDERVALFAVMDDGPIAIATRAVELVAARGGTMTEEEERWFNKAVEVARFRALTNTEAGDLALVSQRHAAQGAMVAVLKARISNLEGRAWVQCTTVSNECLGGCRSMKEHDRQRHQQLVSEVERLKAEVEIGAEIVRDHASRLAAIREIVLKVRKAPRGEAVDSDTYDRGFGDGWVARGAKMRAELDALAADTPNHPASLESSPGNSPKISDGSGEAQRGANAVPVLPGDFALTCSACGGVKPHRWRPSPEAGDFWRCSECGEPSKAARHPCSATCTHEDARTPGHPERIAALSKRLATIDVLHPNGRCTCGGEGLCQWCTETAGREETGAAIESGAVASSFPATTPCPPFQEGYDEGAEAMRAACLEAVQGCLQYHGFGPKTAPRVWNDMKAAIEGAVP
jgi:hypothetical protein